MINAPLVATIPAVMAPEKTILQINKNKEEQEQEEKERKEKEEDDTSIENIASKAME